MIFRARSFTLTFAGPPLIMGVLNVTPDSFSDGGQCLSPGDAVKHALDLIEQGADMIDVGGESTRPKAVPVNEDEELRRVLPVIEGLASQVKVPISIDTMKPAVAEAAIRAGASIVNDVAANREDGSMRQVVAESGAGYVVVHMQGTPQTMQAAPTYPDVVAVIGSFFEERLRRLVRAGVGREQVILDVGIGFGKTAHHNLQLLARMDSFTKWNRPLLLGVSRKSFIQQVVGETAAKERLPGSLACACWAVQRGVNVVRTHDVAATRQAIRMTAAIRSESGAVVDPQPSSETKPGYYAPQ